MSGRDVILLTYRDAGILLAGVLATWIAIYLWAIRDRDNDRPTLWVVIAFCVGFACGWYARGLM